MMMSGIKRLNSKVISGAMFLVAARYSSFAAGDN